MDVLRTQFTQAQQDRAYIYGLIVYYVLLIDFDLVKLVANKTIISKFNLLNHCIVVVSFVSFSSSPFFAFPVSYQIPDCS